MAQAEFAGYTTTVIPSDLSNMYKTKPMSPYSHPHTYKACPRDKQKQWSQRKRRRKRGTPKNMVTDENKKRLEFLQQELSLLEKQIHRNGNIKCTNNNNNWKYKYYQTEYIHDQYNQIKRRNTKNRRRIHIKQIHKSYDNK